MKILVTGAAGQLGSYLVEHLSKEHEVTGLDILGSKYEINNFVKGDIKEKGVLSPLKHIPVKKFMDELKKRGIQIKEETTVLEE